jgi:hypothetical protein
MRKTILSALGAMLMTGSVVQVAAAAKHQFYPTQDMPAIAQYPYFRGAYDQWNGYYDDAPRTLDEERNLEDFGFSGRDLSRPGGEDPSLTPWKLRFTAITIQPLGVVGSLLGGYGSNSCGNRRSRVR